MAAKQGSSMQAKKDGAVIPLATFKFFRELGRNNRTSWMNENREKYQAYIVQPMRALLAALEPGARKLNPRFDTSGRTGQNFSRINRDIRFSKDKAPYRQHMYLMLSEAAPKGAEAGQFYVGVAVDGVTAGFRIYGMEKESPLVVRTRPRAEANEKWLVAQAKRLGRKYESYWYTVEKGEWTKHDGWPVKVENWKKIQGWVVRKKMKTGAATKPGFVKDVEKLFKELWPVWKFTSAANWKR